MEELTTARLGQEGLAYTVMKPVGTKLFGWREACTLSCAAFNICSNKTHRVYILLVDLIIEPDLIGLLVKGRVKDIMVPLKMTLGR